MKWSLIYDEHNTSLHTKPAYGMAANRPNSTQDSEQRRQLKLMLPRPRQRN